MQQSQEKSAAANSGVSPETTNADLKVSAMPIIDRTNLLSRAVSGAALSAALITNGVPAQAQTNAPTEPTPKVAPAVPGATNEVQARFRMLDNFTTQLVQEHDRRAGVPNVIAATNPAATTQTFVIPSNVQPTNAPTYQVVVKVIIPREIWARHFDERMAAQRAFLNTFGK